MTPIELIKMIKEAVSYGDDPFEEDYERILQMYENSKDEKDKQILKELLELFDVLRDRMFR